MFKISWVCTGSPSICKGASFGFMEQSIACPDCSGNGLFIRSIGIERASGIIGLINLTYNLFRYEQIIRLDIKYTDIYK